MDASLCPLRDGGAFGTRNHPRLSLCPALISQEARGKLTNDKEKATGRPLTLYLVFSDGQLIPTPVGSNGQSTYDQEVLH